MLGSIHLNAQTDTINLQRRDVNLLIDNLQYQTNLSANFKNGFDSVRRYYNDAVDSLNKYVDYLKSCMAERDLAHRKIDTLRTNLSKAWTEKDHAVAQAQAEHNKKAKAFGVGPEIGYDPFRKQVYAGIGVHLSIVRFGLFRNNNSNYQPAETHANTLTDKLR